MDLIRALVQRPFLRANLSKRSPWILSGITKRTSFSFKPRTKLHETGTGRCSTGVHMGMVIDLRHLLREQVKNPARLRNGRK